MVKHNFVVEGVCGEKDINYMDPRVCCCGTCDLGIPCIAAFRIMGHFVNKEMNGYYRISGDRRRRWKDLRRQGKGPQHEHEGEGDGERFGVILGRSASVSSSSSSAAMKRAFSMRRSSSVTERYCRIHHIATHAETTSEKGSAKILKACKRIFGF
ncbi:hypothetical protein Fmac_010207 [Flemingia macrophylla]|uniref:Uncharacterized protein n=1 Tax=Flemingia macrophylla TaxID=520843 RepID=A0ABD1N2E0_9FABA